MDQVDPRQRPRRGPGQQFGGIAREQPDIADIVRLDLRQDLGHAVDVGLAADEAGVRKGLRLGDQMFAAAESDFEPDVVDLAIEQLGERRRRAPGDVERQMRQQVIDQVGLVDAELVALAAAEERAARMRMRRRPAARRDRRYRAAESSSQRLVQPVQQPRPRLDRGDVHLLVMGMRPWPSTPSPSSVAVCGAVKLPSEPPPVDVSTRSKPISAAIVLACS